jgi:hypothetical protein
MLDPGRDHPRLDLRSGPGWHPMWPRRTINQTGLALTVEASDPPMRALA